MLSVKGDVYIYLKKKIGEMKGTPYVSMCAVIHGKNRASVWINKINFVLPEGGLKQTIVDDIEKDILSSDKGKLFKLEVSNGYLTARKSLKNDESYLTLNVLDFNYFDLVDQNEIDYLEALYMPEKKQKEEKEEYPF